MLPIIDVRDAAHAHVMMITDKKFDSNGRHFLAEMAQSPKVRSNKHSNELVRQKTRYSQKRAKP